MTKHILTSKMVWFNLIYTLGEVILLVKDIVPVAYVPYVMALQGTINIVLRVWFTNTTLTMTNEQ